MNNYTGVRNTNFTVRYNPDNDHIQIYYNDQWSDALLAGLQTFDIISSSVSDWTTQEMTVTKSNNTIIFASTSFGRDRCENSFNAYLQSESIPIMKGNKLIISGTLNYIGGHTLEVYGIADDGSAYALANIATSSFYKEVDLSTYAGKKFKIKVHLRAADNILRAVFNSFAFSK